MNEVSIVSWRRTGSARAERRTLGAFLSRWG